MELNYGSNSISFRTKVNGQEYGFDFELFANIEPSKCSANTSEDKIVITIQKITPGKWIRLLTSQAKLRFIKSEYNNLTTSSSGEESTQSSGEGSIKKKRSNLFEPTWSKAFFYQANLYCWILWKGKKRAKFSEFISNNNMERKHLGEFLR